MTQKTAPFVEGKYGWDYGESGWNLGADENWIKFSFLFDRNINGIVDNLPPVVNGEAYFLTADSRIYFAVSGNYYSSPVPNNFVVYLKNTNQAYQFIESAMVQIPDIISLGSDLGEVQLIVEGLGTASTQNIEYFATASDLDVVENTISTLKSAAFQESSAFATPASVTAALAPVQLRTTNLETQVYGTGIYDILVAYGQSNALGLAGSSGDANGFPSVLPSSLMFNPDTSSILPIIQGMKSVNGETSTGHAWAEFANQYKRKTKRGLVVLNAARGAMAISTLSKGDASGYYTNLVNGVASTKTAMTNAGLTLGRTLICFHQGETDQLNNTSFETYRSALVTLINNMQSDFGFSWFGICTVGCPFTRLENTWAQIQNAQKYVAQTTPLASIVFDGCPSFTIADGMLNPNGTDEHYSQKAYNLMGYHAANSFADVVDNAGRVKTLADISEYGANGKFGPSWARPERVSGLVSYVNSAWSISSRDSSVADFRSSGVSSVAVINTNTLRVKLSNRADFMFETYAKVSQAAIQNSLYVHASKNVVGNDYFIDLQFYIDLDIVVSITNGNIFYGRPIAAAPTWLSNFVSSSLASNVVTLTHGATISQAITSHNGGGGSLQGTPAATYSSSPSATTTLIGFGGVATTNPVINVRINRVSVPLSALALLSGFAVEFAATIAPNN